MKKLKLFLLFSLLALSASAINAPQLRCLSVGSDGSVTLNWQAPTDLSDFDHYEIFYSTNINGPYTSIAQIADANFTNFVHNGAQAIANAQCFYYVQACSFNACVSSDTLVTIEFYLSNYGNGTAVLNWEAPINPLLNTYSSDYEIFREYPSGVWTNVGTASSLIYRDIIDVCEASLGYRVELADASGCRNVSRALSDIFNDHTAPDVPQLDSVSVDFATQQIQLGWEISSSPDVSAYIIYHEEGNMWISVDTVQGFDHTYWTDNNNDAQQLNNYRIAAMDSCMNTSPMTDAQHNFWVTGAYDICRREATIAWTAYENLPLDVEKYEIYYSDNGSALQYVGETTNLNFLISGLIPMHTYQCVVRAVNYSGTIKASSAQFEFTFEAPENHDLAYVSTVSVVDNAKLEIKVYTGETENFSGVNLYRSCGSDTNFVFLQSLRYDGSNLYIFEDEGVRVNKDLYYYRAAIVNECDAETAISNIAHNILLTGSSDVNVRENVLNWTHYEGWNGGRSGYTVYRKSEYVDSYEIICPSQTANYHPDDVFNLRREGGIFSYYVEAQENVNDYGFAEVSRSNTIELAQAPVTYIPNAFAPWNDGPNSVFLPIHSFVAAENYDMYIYSREGIMLFHTQDPQMGWSGGYNGTLLPAAAYVYKITYTYREKEYEYVGTVTLVR